MTDPRTPVVVGGGQLNRRDDPLEPVDLMVEAVRLAAADAGAPALAQRVDSVRVVGTLSWPYRDPGALVGERLGAAVRHTVCTGAGGSHPQALLHDAAEDVAAGRCDVVVVTGAEAWRTRTRLMKEEREPDWTVQGDDVPEPSVFKPDVAFGDDTEFRSQLDRPTSVYPLFEQALRITAGRSHAEHQRFLGELWARFSEVAAGNPHAWIDRVVGADEIATATPGNRMVATPYTKLLCSNNSVDQGAAVIVCSAGAARAAGVPDDRWVFPLAGVEAADTVRIGERPRLDGSPAIRLAGARALELAGVGLEDVGPVDLYSCFPSAVQVAALELGLPLDDPSRPLTVTGGLTFAGGPWNDYVTHALATMLGEVRRTGSPGLVTANSGYLSKHAIGVLAPAPGAGGFRRESVQDAVDAVPSTPLAATYAGPAELESWTVRHDRGGAPDLAMAALRTPDGARTLASCDDPDVMARLVGEEAEGSRARVSEDGTFAL